MMAERRALVANTGGKFLPDLVCRINWPNHGYTSQIQHLKVIRHAGGVTVAVTSTEWRKMEPPLLVQENGQWRFAGYPVEVKEVSENTQLHMRAKGRRSRHEATVLRQITPE